LRERVDRSEGRNKKKKRKEGKIREIKGVGGNKFKSKI
jgi:hypothetical protein